MRFFRVIIIILTANIVGIVVNSCCEGYAYRWAYIITSNLDIDRRRNYDYGMRIHFFEQKLIGRYNYIFTNDIYATSCNADFPVKDSITDIEIITMNNFNENTGSGEDVSNYFKELYHDQTIEETVKRINEDNWNVIDYLDLVVIDDVISKSEHQFIVNVHLSDKTIMSDTTEALTLY